jgi:YHS domain-containing protein
MGRLIIYAAICFLAYMFLKIWSSRSRAWKTGRMKGRYPPAKPPPIIDELVQDPVCGVYCPKGEAVQLYYKGKTYYFCSKECMNSFTHSHR